MNQKYGEIHSHNIFSDKFQRWQTMKLVRNLSVLNYCISMKCHPLMRVKGEADIVIFEWRPTKKKIFSAEGVSWDDARLDFFQSTKKWNFGQTTSVAKFFKGPNLNIVVWWRQDSWVCTLMSQISHWLETRLLSKEASNSSSSAPNGENTFPFPFRLTNSSQGWQNSNITPMSQRN